MQIHAPALPVEVRYTRLRKVSPERFHFRHQSSECQLKRRSITRPQRAQLSRQRRADFADRGLAVFRKRRTEYVRRPQPWMPLKARRLISPSCRR
jgi:hypothetical protein